MPKRYACLLRGINVGGHKQIKMEELRELCSGLGYRNVRTYIQSGNVIFDASSGTPSSIAAKIKAAIDKEFGFEVPILVLSDSSLKGVIEGNPFLNDPKVDATKLHVAFLSAPASRPALARLAEIPSGKDEFRAQENVLYLYLPGGAGKTKLTNTAIEKSLGVDATGRNWKTVNELYRLTELNAIP